MPKAKLVTDINNTYFTNNKITVGTSAPTTGTYKAGDVVYSSAPNSTAYGWICTASGTPGSWKVLKSGTDVTNIDWNNIIGRPGTYPPNIGNSSTTAFRGDLGAVAYNHSQHPHAPANAQRNADITRGEIEAKLTGTLETHGHYALTCKDNRGENTLPCNYYVGFETNLKNRSTVDYPAGDTDFTAIAAIKPWNDRSGGACTQLSFCSVWDHTPKISVRTAPADDTRWGEWATIFTSADHMLNLSPGNNGDFGFGIRGKEAGMVGCFKGWDKDRLYINTYSDSGDKRSTYGAVEVNGNVDLGGYTTAHGGMTVHNLLYSTADISTDKNLYVPKGMISVGGLLDVYGGANIHGGMDVWGYMTAKDGLSVGGADLYVDKSATIANKLYVTNGISTDGSLYVPKGMISVGGLLDIYGGANIRDGMSVWGTLTAKDQFNTDKDAYIGGSITVEHQVYVRRNVDIAGRTDLRGILNVEGESVLRSFVTCGNGMRVWGYMTAEDGMSVGKNLYVESGINTDGNIRAAGRVSTEGYLEIQGHQLFIQWDDPGWGNEGAIWIRS